MNTNRLKEREKWLKEIWGSLKRRNATNIRPRSLEKEIISKLGDWRSTKCIIKIKEDTKGFVKIVGYFHNGRYPKNFNTGSHYKATNVTIKLGYVIWSDVEGNIYFIRRSSVTIN